MLDKRDKAIRASQLCELERSGNRICRLGVNFAVCGADAKVILLCGGGKYDSSQPQLEAIARDILERHENGMPANGTDVPVWRFCDDSLVLAATLQTSSPTGSDDGASGVVMVDMGDETADCCGTVRKNSASLEPSAYCSELLKLLVENYRISIKTDEQMEKVGTELAQTYEELVLLHKLGTNMRVTEADANFLQMACDNLTEIVLVEGIAVLIEKEFRDESQLVLAAGSGLIDIDPHMAALLHSRLVAEMDAGKEALLDSAVGSEFKYEWPASISNILAVPLCGKEKGAGDLGHGAGPDAPIMGLMVAVNRVDKADFDSIDANLFNSVASSCAVFMENGRLFGDLKELFIGSLRALTSSIDAKDQYTRGHSERVAIISRWIAERVAQQEKVSREQMHRVYLAGLLHDIGKIGINEAVLRKCGKLTEDERECVKKHPSIGAEILREIPQMRDIVPGVLCHHERVDGKGYPNGLSGDGVPLLGRIVGLADSFDAMTSKRTYRDAMTVQAALDEVEKGLGTQFDENIGRIFLESDIEQLWEMLQNGPHMSTGPYEGSNFAQYGAAAVGTLIR